MDRKKKFMSDKDKAKTKVFARRKGTLLQEYKLKDKEVFWDRRIGEKKSQKTMSEEDKAMTKFAAERAKIFKKQSIFNLNDEEVLTHRGQLLEDIEKFDNPQSDDEDYEDERKSGKLDKKFVSDLNFGGGLLSKSNKDVSRKTLIEQIILNSKLEKSEKRKVREETIDLTKKLDADWVDLLPIVTSANKTLTIEESKSRADDYDMAVRELKFSARGTPSDKLKSEEQRLTEEVKNLEKLEKERLMRMNGFSENERKHRSADDLEDYFHVEKIEVGSDDEDDEKEISDENDDVEDENVNDDVDNNSDASIDDGKDDDGEDDGEDDEEEDDNEDENSISDYSDLDDDISDESSSSETEVIDDKESEKKETNKQPKPKIKECDAATDPEKVKLEEKARTELPYTFAAPENYEDLETLLNDRNPEYQNVIVERIIKCNHWQLADKNRQKLSNLFTFLMQYVNKCATVRTEEDVIRMFQIVDRLCPHFYDLVHANPESTKNCLKDIITEKHDCFENKLNKYPKLDTLILFKLVSVLYPTSDFRHPITTPCVVFMSQILLNCRVKHKSDIAKGLFISTMMLEYTSLSKRFDPSAIQFLRWVIYVSIPKTDAMPGLKTFPFKTFNYVANILALEKSHEDEVFDISKACMRGVDLVGREVDEDFRIRAFVTAINLTMEFKSNLENMDAAYSIFAPISKLLKKKFLKSYPESVKLRALELKKSIQSLKERKLESLTFVQKKPKALRLYEPRIEEVFTGQKRRVMSKEKLEREKLVHKLKKETKGAIREIRRDSAFLSRVQIKEQISRDSERKRKVKEIFGEAAVQQSELKKFKKKR